MFEMLPRRSLIGAMEASGHVKRPCWVSLLVASWVIFRPALAGCASGSPRTVRYWMPFFGSAVDPSNTSCSPAFLENITRFASAIDVLAPYTWQVTPNGWILDDSTRGCATDGAWACMTQLSRKFPHLRIGAVGTKAGPDGYNDTSINSIAKDPETFQRRMQAWLNMHPEIDEVWTDFEGWDEKRLSLAEWENVTRAHELMALIKTTAMFNWLPGVKGSGSENVTCAKFQALAPHVVMQDPRAYDDTTIWPSKSVYGGFEVLVNDSLQECPQHTKLSVSICPDCPSPRDRDDNLTQAQLYTRMDHMCDYGVKDVSVFTFFELAKRPDQLGVRYLEALSYFRTGHKGLTSQEKVLI